MLAAAAHFPDAVVALDPDLFEMRQERLLEVPAGVDLRQAALARLMQRVHHFAEDVELTLIVRGVADANRRRVS